MNTNLFDKALSVDLTENINILRKFMEAHTPLKEDISPETKKRWSEDIVTQLAGKTQDQLFNMFFSQNVDDAVPNQNRNRFEQCFLKTGFDFTLTAKTQTLKHFFDDTGNDGAEVCFNQDGLSLKVTETTTKEGLTRVHVGFIRLTQNAAVEVSTDKLMTTAIGDEAKVRKQLHATASAVLEDTKIFTPSKTFTTNTIDYHHRATNVMLRQYEYWEENVCSMLNQVADGLAIDFPGSSMNCMRYIVDFVSKQGNKEAVNALDKVIKACLSPITALGQDLRHSLLPFGDSRQITLRPDTVVPYIRHLGIFTFNEAALTNELYMIGPQTAKKATRIYQDQTVRLHDFGIGKRHEVSTFILWMNYANNIRNVITQRQNARIRR